MQAMIAKGEGIADQAAFSGAPAAAGKRKTSSPSTSEGVEGEIEVTVADMVEPEEISLPQLSEKAHQISKLLSAIEPLDQLIWSLFLDPVSTISDCRALARTLSTAGTASQNAYQALKQVARCIPLKNLLHPREQVIKKERTFILDVTTFINSVKDNRTLEASSRQLMPLKKILDHAVGGLVRLEALKTNFMFGQEHPDDYSREAVTAYYEEALRSITDLWDPGLRAQVRQRADADTDAMRTLFEAEKYVAKMLVTARAYTMGLQDSGCTKSVEELKEAFAENPLEFKDVEDVNTSEAPPELLISCGLGEICDEVSRYVTTQAWEVMQPIHRPEETIKQIQVALREVLVSASIFTAETKRHQERASIGIPVVSLDKVSGNINLKDYYIPVRDNGQIAYLENFEDGSFVDLFELREYKPARVHAAAKKEAQEEQTEELQKGRKYLFTIGRTNRLFGESPSDLINGCIRSEGGGPKIFPVF